MTCEEDADAFEDVLDWLESSSDYEEEAAGSDEEMGAPGWSS